MKKRIITAVAAVAIAAGTGGIAIPAFAASTSPDLTAVYLVPGGPHDAKGQVQTYISNIDGADLAGARTLMACGTTPLTYQADILRRVAKDGTHVETLWADGKLHPNTDGKFLDYGVGYQPYTVVTVPACATPTPTPTPTVTPEPTGTPTPIGTPSPTVTPIPTEAPAPVVPAAPVAPAPVAQPVTTAATFTG